MEAQVDELQCEREARMRELERAKFEWKEMKTDLDTRIEKGKRICCFDRFRPTYILTERLKHQWLPWPSCLHFSLLFFV